MKKDNRVELPREVAESIDECRKLGKDNTSILWEVYEGESGRIINGFMSTDKSNFDVLLAALVNGYTIAGTPEQKVANYVEQLREDMMRWKIPLMVDQARWQLEGLTQTLDLLGVKIAGVNDFTEIKEAE
jgi:hypothetical protein